MWNRFLIFRAVVVVVANCTCFALIAIRFKDCLGARFVKQFPHALGALGGSFEYGWMRVLGREGNNSQRCMSPALVSITAVAGDVSL